MSARQERFLRMLETTWEGKAGWVGTGTIPLPGRAPPPPRAAGTHLVQLLAVRAQLSHDGFHTAAAGAQRRLRGG